VTYEYTFNYAIENINGGIVKCPYGKLHDDAIKRLRDLGYEITLLDENIESKKFNRCSVYQIEKVNAS
jgi:argonaute-like protein implicated in RNA metabolism and viral defense